MAPPSPPERKTSARPSQPVIWAEGRQQPPFDLRAFGRVSLLLARQGAGPVLDSAARHVAAGSAAVAAGRGRIPEARLGRSGRYLPSHQRVAAGLGHLAGVIRGASDMVLPPPAPVEPLAHPDLLSLAPKTHRQAERLADLPKPALPQPAAEASPEPVRETRQRRPRPAPAKPAATPETSSAPAEQDPQLDAIRALLAEVQASPAPPREPAPEPARTVSPRRPEPVALPARQPPVPVEIRVEIPVEIRTGEPGVGSAGSAPASRSLRLFRWIAGRRLTQSAVAASRRGLAQLSVRVIGWGATAVALPFAAIRAALLHLNGQDLRRID